MGISLICCERHPEASGEESDSVGDSPHHKKYDKIQKYLLQFTQHTRYQKPEAKSL